MSVLDNALEMLRQMCIHRADEIEVERAQSELADLREKCTELQAHKERTNQLATPADFVVEQNEFLRKKCAQLEKDVQVAKGQYEGACIIIKQLEDKNADLNRQLVCEKENTKKFMALQESTEKLYKIASSRADRADRLMDEAAINLPALIEQARKEEREECAQICDDYSANFGSGMFDKGASDCADAIRARKP